MNKPFEPNITSFKKFRRRHPKGIIKNAKLVMYNFGIQVVTAGKIFSYHVEVMRLTVVTFFKRKHKPYIRIMPNVSYTTKPHDIRRGRGKGSVESWYFYAREGKILLEFNAIDFLQAKSLASIIRSKMPIKIKLIQKQNLFR